MTSARENTRAALPAAFGQSRRAALLAAASASAFSAPLRRCACFAPRSLGVARPRAGAHAGMRGCTVRETAPSSRAAFEREFEAPALPVIFTRLAADWPAVARWDPQRDGLAHLARLASEAPVEVMLSTNGCFSGSTRDHRPTGMTFGESLERAVKPSAGVTSQNIYLAQAPLQRTGAPQPQPLAPLLADLPAEPPCCVPAAKLASTSLWLSGWRGSCGSIHYDCYHNLLVVLAGKKDVMLWSPAETPSMYPQQVGGEAGNHSELDIAYPTPERHPRFPAALQRAISVTLLAGDALFIPEGFWHQVNSHGTTIAVNYWWHSAFSELVGSHMDAYYARRLMESLVAAEKRQLVDGLVHAVEQQQPADLADDNSVPSPKRARVDPDAPRDWADESLLRPDEKNAVSCFREHALAADPRHPPDISFAFLMMFRTCTSLGVQNVLGHLAATSPALLRKVMLEGLDTPRLAETLTHAFEEADEARGGNAASDGEAGFYGVFYQALDDERDLFMRLLLRLKEQFAADTAQHVAQTVLGVRGPPPDVEA